MKKAFTLTQDRSLQSTKKKRRQPRFLGLSTWIIKKLERIMAISPALFKAYGGLFYGSVLRRELAAASLKPGDRVLHIGSGALPYTAYYLDRCGYDVTAVDHDAATLPKAKSILSRLGCDVRLIIADGSRVNIRGYAAVFVSLHVSQKDALLRRTLSELSPQSYLIYRQPRGWLSLLYRPVAAGPLPPVYHERRSQHRHRLGKESHVLQKKDAASLRGASLVPLSDLSPGQRGIVHEIADDPLLSPLGIRRGKGLRFVAQSVADGPVLVEVDRRIIAVALPLARNIYLSLGD